MTSVAESDPLNSVKLFLHNNWDATQTDNIYPDFYLTTEQPPRLDYSGGGFVSGSKSSPTKILIYQTSHEITPNDLGPAFRMKTVDRVSIDIRSRYSRDHTRKVYNQVRACFQGKYNWPDANFQQVIPINFQDFSTINFFRYVYDIYLRNWTVSQ
jgi:hypothetical protein